MIDHIKTTFEKEVFAICTDNENKMKSMKEIVKKTHSGIVTVGCSAHYINLVEKEVTPTTVLKHLIEVQKYFMNTHLAHAWLKEKGGLAPQLPNATRWNSQIDCVKSYVTNHHIYVQIRTEEAEFNPAIAKILDNKQLYKEAVNLCQQLTLVGNALDKLQKDETTLSDAFEIWKGLIEETKLESYKSAFEKRFKQALTDVHFLANLTDPRYFGERLTSKQESDAEAWIQDHHPEFLPGLLALKIKDVEFFSKTVFEPTLKTSFKPSKLWKLVESKSAKLERLLSNFCKFFQQLHSVPCSSASIERVFSTFGMVWSKVRNRLGTEKAEQLVKVYRFLREEHDPDW